MGGFTTNNKLITAQIVIIMFTGRATPHLAITRNWVDYIKRWMLFFWVDMFVVLGKANQQIILTQMTPYTNSFDRLIDLLPLSKLNN